MRKMSEMPYHIGLVLKMYPSHLQKRIVAVNDGVKRAVYNLLVASNNEIYRMKKTADFVPVYRERIAYLCSVTSSTAGIKQALPFLQEKLVDSLAVDNAYRNYHTAWKNQKERHTGVPVFKKKSYEQSYQTNAHYYKDGRSNVRFDDVDHITLPVLKRVRIGGPKELIHALMHRKADTRIGSVKIWKDSVGEYWVSLSIASEEPFHEPLKKTGSAHGIDLNLIDLINDSDGGSAENRHFYKKTEEKLAKAQRKLSRMAEQSKKEKRPLKGSKNYQKQRIRVAKLNRQTARQRKDYLHVLSKREVENQDFIAAENLKVSNLLKNHHLAKAVADASWRTFLTMLQYKAGFYGKTVILVPPKNTTQTCSACGYVLKGEQKLTLADREWVCPNCGTKHLRDTNAATVILQRGLETAGRS